ncbi:E3 ubiquitin-protein ligase RMND5A-like [Oscarella lobularis]|uniref:E3 ubiquitin-protein ligase RMND5A-like n=1 Tax=Oscarella lobularis TaxID=121494 RepID=UPI003313ED51
MADSIRAVEREWSKASAKVDLARLVSTQKLGDLSAQLGECGESLRERGADDDEMSDEQVAALSEHLQKVRDGASKVSSDHKELHGNISKIGRAIDKNFTIDLDASGQENVFEAPERARMLNGVLCDHFLRQGRLDVARRLAEEAGLNLKDEAISPFVALNQILESCQERNLEPVLSWAEANGDWLKSRNSCLAFKLHRLKFLSLLEAGERARALEYAKNFAPYAEMKKREFQQLMGCLAYAGKGLSTSPYAFLLDPVYWTEACDEFMKEACALSGLPVTSHLSAGLAAGCSALPNLLQIKSVLRQRHVHDMWSAMDELPIEIDIGSEQLYHSIFACPIMKQQSTSENPPMRLSCGHVISRDAIDRLLTGLRLKCPYCPVEMQATDTKVIHF